MPNHVFGLLWISFPHQALNSKTSSSFAECDKSANAEWRKQDDGYYKKKPNDKNYPPGRKWNVAARHFCHVTRTERETRRRFSYTLFISVFCVKGALWGEVRKGDFFHSTPERTYGPRMNTELNLMESHCACELTLQILMMCAQSRIT